MASIAYYYRSIKKKSELTVRFLYSYKGINYQPEAKIKVSVSKYYWKNIHFKNDINDPKIEEEQLSIKSELNKIKRFLLDSIENKPDKSKVNKDWLTKEVNLYYSLSSNSDLPRILVNYIDYYIECKKHDLADSTKSKYRVLKNKLIRYQNNRNYDVQIKDVGERFKDDFINYQRDLKYAQNTIHKDIALIKTFCNHAKKYGLETHPQLKFFKTKKEDVGAIYLSTSELEQIKNAKDISKELEITRDWLLISCEIGQRISDFMNFNKTKVWEKNGKYYMDFVQKKTGKRMTIPILDEAKKVLRKNNGEFPKKISFSTYNENLKELCRMAGITEKVHGKILQKTEGVDGLRRVAGSYEKYKLVSSHIGRRSFATNMYGKISTQLIMSITGHSTEKMFKNYVVKNSEAFALDFHNNYDKLKELSNDL
ncbi:site-specific integrase [Psychroflexus sp. CAK57W]|uniref:phage integrase SAM-like domain-containing protein n=1 Tax=Psychroflexus curvus TaxID=2873595 RepID=UPI001CCBE3EB|nr:phage integrase SAM-like domain-containing protein [Psychroflexus curvus]MBZ9787000.1 site-specific integrase [Psychroflexus curvus]